MIRYIKAGVRAATFSLAALAITATTALAQDIRIGAMREGTSWYVFAATLEQMIEPMFGANSVEVVARGGGVANPMVVQNGRAEIALSNVATAVWAYNGNPVYEGASAPDIRALVGGLNNVYVGVMARQAFLDERGTTDLAEILASGEPVRILIKPVGSSAVPAAEMILEGLGTNVEGIRANGGDVIQVDTPQIPDILRNGDADIYIDTVIRNHPTITEVTLTAGMRFLDIPQAAMDVLTANGLAAGTYGPWFEGQDDANIGANLGTVLIANASLSDDAAYQITRTLIEHAAEMGEAHAAWRAFNPENAWRPENTGIPLHPGAERYFRERGWM
ncbi:TAXI family TRAP transporter solute-binding subunit [Loktanella sp. IMCC34160]|uniref:TAXI family TRAP transporter solute-binding subunit n=1 Tax=Loktanella sp. IMCC34160 TaxID=2510646 RepID=UPI00101C606D|nr:TAXI family TRAP transporter solute-binding subunit [Loktanella sp. IMCC34160]RYG91764.1 TAXI family TRAP transporter solute-binding subunit [Loktanella sp. IMCC34160]